MQWNSPHIKMPVKPSTGPNSRHSFGSTAWVKHKGLRVIVVFEGDAAGKGGTIKAPTERVSPRVFRVVALPAPSDREKSQNYLQRYMQHFRRRVRS
jgi:polyphosphate kinase 2 (PPK2 family)